MSSAKECKECITGYGLNTKRCDICRPIQSSHPPLNISGCIGTCCSCIQKHGGKTDAVPCQMENK